MNTQEQLGFNIDIPEPPPVQSEQVEPLEIEVIEDEDDDVVDPTGQDDVSGPEILAASLDSCELDLIVVEFGTGGVITSTLTAEEEMDGLFIIGIAPQSFSSMVSLGVKEKLLKNTDGIHPHVAADLGDSGWNAFHGNTKKCMTIGVTMNPKEGHGWAVFCVRDPQGKIILKETERFTVDKNEVGPKPGGGQEWAADHIIELAYNYVWNTIPG